MTSTAGSGVASISGEIDRATGTGVVGVTETGTRGDHDHSRGRGRGHALARHHGSMVIRNQAVVRVVPVAPVVTTGECRCQWWCRRSHSRQEGNREK